MIDVAVSVTNNCDYRAHSHTASAFKGMTTGRYQELMAVIAMAHHTNALANGLRIPVDLQYLVGG
jgi:AhpD family alkylhydroperoxidase